MRIENASMNRRPFKSKSRITTAESTVVLKLNIAASGKRDVIVCQAPFCFFLEKQKEE
jgi:hypothetical protein